MRRNLYTVEWDPQAAKIFRKMKEQKLKDHILDIIENEIAGNPLSGKPLSGALIGIRSYRSGVLRILYKFYVDRLVIVILDIDHRKDAYRR